MHQHEGNECNSLDITALTLIKHILSSITDNRNDIYILLFEKKKRDIHKTGVKVETYWKEQNPC